jgi:hypothetical protein
VKIARGLVEKNFAKAKKLKVIHRRITGAEDGGEDGNDSAKVDLPDARKSQNIEIMLRRLPSLSRLMEAIYYVDKGILDSETIELIYQNVRDVRCPEYHD